eukprot:3500194-Amphidinium_carterae.2
MSPLRKAIPRARLCQGLGPLTMPGEQAVACNLRSPDILSHDVWAVSFPGALPAEATEPPGQLFFVLPSGVVERTAE